MKPTILKKFGISNETYEKCKEHFLKSTRLVVLVRDTKKRRVKNAPLPRLIKIRDSTLGEHKDLQFLNVNNYSKVTKDVVFKIGFDEPYNVDSD